MPERRLQVDGLIAKLSLLCFVVLGLITVIIAAADTTLKSYADKVEVEIGDPIHYTIEVAHPSNRSIQFPQIPETWGDFDILSSVQKTGAAQEDGLRVDSLQLVLAAYKVGDLQIPAVDMDSASSDGATHRLHAPPFSVRVRSLLPQEPAENIAPKDVKPVIDLPEPSSGSLATALIAIGAILFVLGFLYLKRKRYHRPEALLPPAAEDLSPESAALQAIERLLQSRPFAKEPKLFYVELVVILKIYLEQRYHLKTLERTTREILHDLRTRQQDVRLIDLAHRVFNACDIAKFSTYVPNEKEAQQLVEQAISIVKRET